MQNLYWRIYNSLFSNSVRSADILLLVTGFFTLLWIILLLAAWVTHAVAIGILMLCVAALLLTLCAYVGMQNLQRIVSLVIAFHEESDAVDERLTHLEKRMNVQDEIEQELIEAVHVLNGGKDALAEAITIIEQDRERKARRRARYASKKLTPAQEEEIEQEENEEEAIGNASIIPHPNMYLTHAAQQYVDYIHPTTAYANTVPSTATTYTLNLTSQGYTTLIKTPEYSSSVTIVEEKEDNQHGKEHTSTSTQEQQ